MKIFFHDKTYDDFELINGTFFIKNKIGDTIKCKNAIEFEIECVKCLSKIKIKKIKRYHLDKDYICIRCRTKGENNPMYGKRMSDEKKLEISKKNSGENNPFFGKKHTDETKKKIGEKNKEHMKGENNPMYKKSVFDIWVEKYGKEKADELMKNKSLKHSFSGENNPFFGKKHTDETRKKLSESLKNSDKLKKLVNSKEYREKMSNKLKNRKFSDEHKRKLRLSRIKNIKYLNNGQILPNFSLIGCEILNKISTEKNIYIQHAMNDGEFYIKELGYWVDGYDKLNNVVYEIDESGHFDMNGELKEKDIKRQTQIENHLGCQFIRIKI